MALVDVGVARRLSGEDESDCSECTNCFAPRPRSLFNDQRNASQFMTTTTTTSPRLHFTHREKTNTAHVTLSPSHPLALSLQAWPDHASLHGRAAPITASQGHAHLSRTLHPNAEL
ncbi:hypothetical protein E2C01_059531 [Portunus trituberculatus]|uniref:Uncharacterized protein n=1 Tax=Portunus trituberculatus TaxID=210409 RepID=A0A5B7H805_PORTR|nr:hypothetical protein [Portunus trituberculatus]